MGLFSSSKSKSAITTTDISQASDDFAGMSSPQTTVNAKGSVAQLFESTTLVADNGSLNAQDSDIIGSFGDSKMFYVGQRGYFSLSAAENSVINLGGTVEKIDTQAVVEGVTEGVSGIMDSIAGIGQNGIPPKKLLMFGAIAFAAFLLLRKVKK